MVDNTLVIPALVYFNHQERRRMWRFPALVDVFCRTDDWQYSCFILAGRAYRPAKGFARLFKQAIELISTFMKKTLLATLLTFSISTLALAAGEEAAEQPAAAPPEKVAVHKKAATKKHHRVKKQAEAKKPAAEKAAPATPAKTEEPAPAEPTEPSE